MQDDGTFAVTVTSDSHAGAFLNVPAATLAATDPELLAWLNGSRVDLVFGALGDLSAGASASADVSLYLVPAADATRPPPASANAVASEDHDGRDARGARGRRRRRRLRRRAQRRDPQPAGAAPPVLVGAPGTPVHVAVGAPAIFKISSPQDGVTAGALPPHGDGDARGRVGGLRLGRHRRSARRRGREPAARRRRERERERRARGRARDPHRLRQGRAAGGAHLYVVRRRRDDAVGDDGRHGRLLGDGARRLRRDVRRERRRRGLAARDRDPHRAVGDGQPPAGRAVGHAAQRRAPARAGRARHARAHGAGRRSRRRRAHLRLRARPELAAHLQPHEGGRHRLVHVVAGRRLRVLRHGHRRARRARPVGAREDQDCDGRDLAGGPVRRRRRSDSRPRRATATTRTRPSGPRSSSAATASTTTATC